MSKWVFIAFMMPRFLFAYSIPESQSVTAASGFEVRTESNAPFGVGPDGMLHRFATDNSGVLQTSGGGGGGGAGTVAISVNGAVVNAGNPLPTYLTVGGGGYIGTTVEAFANGVSLTVIGNGDANSDGDTVELNLLAAETYGMVYNGSTWDRMRGNTSGLFVTTTGGAPLVLSFAAGAAGASSGNPLYTFQTGTQFTLSTLNSSSVQLGAGATFTGTIEAAFNQPGVQVMVVSDQPVTVYVDQFDGANNLVDTDTFTRLAGVPTSENIQINADAVRVRVTNNGGSPTTTLRIETTYGPLSPFPSANTSQGNFKTSLQESAITLSAAIASYPGAYQGCSVAAWTASQYVGVSLVTSVALALSGPAATAFTYAAVNQGITLTAAGFQGALFIIPAVLTGSTLQAFTSLDAAGTQQHQTMLFYEAAGTAPTYVASIAAPAAGSQIYVMTDGAPYVILRCTTYATGGAVYGVPTNSSSVHIGMNILGAGANTIGAISALPTGSNVIGGVNLSFPVNTNALSISSPAFAGGATATGFIKASAAMLMRVEVQSLSGSVTNTATVHIYNQATAPTAGVATNIVSKISATGYWPGVADFGPQGVALATGLAYSITALPQDTDATAPPALSNVIFVYK